MLDPHLVFVGAAIGLSGSVLYARDTFRGVTQPNRVTWTLWAIAPTLVFIDELRQGVGLQSVMTCAIAIGPLLVLLASFANANSVWKIGPFDVACGAASVMGLIVWLVTSNDSVALVAFMAADFLAGLPTLVKSYREPASESANTYLTSMVSAALTLATVTVWSSAVVAFPLQILIFNAVLVALIAGRLGPRLRHEHRAERAVSRERVISPVRGSKER